MKPKLKSYQLAALKSVRKVYAPKVQVVPAEKGGAYHRPANKKWIEDLRWD
jgi:hypothetical protein